MASSRARKRKREASRFRSEQLGDAEWAAFVADRDQPTPIQSRAVVRSAYFHQMSRQESAEFLALHGGVSR